MQILEPRSDPHEPRPPTPVADGAIRWVLWLGILSSAVLIYVIFGCAEPKPKAKEALAWIGLAPLLISLVARWVIAPRVKISRQHLVIFILGISTAEGATILASMLGTGQPRDLVAIAGIVGVLQWIPLSTSRPVSR
jgi:hypothetical protein